MGDENKALSFVEKMKLKALNQEKYGGPEPVAVPAKVGVTNCANCGAGRAIHEGLTKCCYCGFEFLAVVLSDGLHIKKEDNSR